MAEATIRSRYVMAGRVRIHYSEAGENGPPVVLLHGGGAGSSGQAGFGRIMPRLAGQYTVYALDSVGGFGDTDPSFPATYGVQSRVEQLEDFADALCLDQFCVGGNSQGAWVAARYAILHPDRVKKLIMVASSTIANAMGYGAR
jgi:pimeloyl-ACP methyl ester carboxylesterase